MNHSHDSPGARFRRALDDAPLIIPGVFNALTARMAERAGFRAVYQSGAALSAGLAAVPDIGLISQTEFAEQARYLTEAVAIPVISDADTGFGEPIVVERTVQLFEAAGLAGLHLEDQQLPKRCGHLSGKKLVTTDEMVAKIKAAVAARNNSAFTIIARTDARAVESMESALERSAAYVEAGADMVFPEALQTADEFAKFAVGVEVPLIANMTEFGKSPLLSAKELGEMGYAAVLFPVTLLRVAMQAVRETLSEIAEQGTQRHLIDRMLTRAELYDQIDYEGYDRRDQEYFGG
jgi:methylisocitrate lyase